MSLGKSNSFFRTSLFTNGFSSEEALKIQGEEKKVTSSIMAKLEMAKNSQNVKNLSHCFVVI